MSSIAIITARGGSKRIPRKNIKPFCGVPIIAYSIQAALDSNLFDEVMVSTDDSEIADVSRRYGASVPFMRSEHTSDDHATTADVLLEVIGKYAQDEKQFEYACCIYPTAPFVTAGKLQEAFSILEESKACETVFTSVPFSFPPQRGLLNENGYAIWWQPQHALTRSQDLPDIYHDAGQFYFFRINSFLKSHMLVGQNSRMLLISELEAQDIDNPSDWELAELKFKRMSTFEAGRAP